MKILFLAVIAVLVNVVLYVSRVGSKLDYANRQFKAFLILCIIAVLIYFYRREE